jgi:hypothetical protein
MKKNRKIPLIYLGILVGSIFFVLGCSERPLKSLKFNEQKSTESSRSDDTSETQEISDITRSDDICTDGRIFLGTDDNNRGDNIYVAGPSAIKEIHDPEKRYRIWYSGYEGSAWRIYHANSADGNTWKKKNNEVPKEGTLDTDETDPFSALVGEYGTDGRIPLTPDFARDKLYVANPSVLRERRVEAIGEVPGAPNELTGGPSGKPEYHAWYGGYDEQVRAWRIFYANSNNGFFWMKYLDHIIIDIKPNSLEKIYVHNPTVVLDINKFCCSCKHSRCCEANRMYHMWYSGYDGSAWRIFYATSATGETPWQRHGMVLDLGRGEDCDDLYVSEPTVVLEKKYIPSCCGLTCMEGSRIYHMWYAGYGGDPDNKECENIGWRIFYASSTDGVHWKKRKEPVLNLGEAGKGDKIYVAGPTVISDTALGSCGGSGPPFIMWYAGYDGSRWLVYKAKSNDGIHWDKVNNSLP